MRIVHADEVEWFGSVGHREAGVDFKRLLRGPEASADNFELNIARVAQRYRTPRHRHNFDQVRFVLSGSFGYGGDRVQRAGSVGYFPEGCHYRQEGEGESWTLLLQTAGASGAPYLSYDKLRETVAELARRGEFSGGVYSYVRAQDGRRIRQDGYEAVWEYATGLELEYPRPRYQAPIIMDPAAFRYLPEPDAVRVRRKRLGRFTERSLEIGFLEFGAGGRYRFDGAAAGDHLFYVLSGRGRAGAAPWRERTAMHLEGADTVWLEAETAAEIYYLRLPDRQGSER